MATLNNFDCDALNIIAGSREFVFLSLHAIDRQGMVEGYIDLSTVDEIEWLFAPYSMLKEKSYAIAHKRMSTGAITILEDGGDGGRNRIQVIIEADTTKKLHGAFLHQIIITDRSGGVFVPFEGIININRRIQVI